MTRRNQETTETMRQALIASPHTYDDLCAVSGLSKPAVARWIKQLRDVGLVHVASYATDVRGRLFVPCFGWGQKADRVRPGQQRTAADRMRDMRQRRRAAA